MAELNMTDTSDSSEKRQQSVLSIICLVAAALFLALVAYNLFAAGAVISTDGLFFTVVPLLLALCFLVVPGFDMWQKRKEAQAGSPAGVEDAHAAAHAAPEEEIHFAGSNKLFSIIWLWLLGLTAVEVLFGYINLPVVYMLVILMGASIIKAALIVAYFMHLKFERLSLILTLVPMLVVCILLWFVFFPDSYRSLGLRYQFKEAPPVAPAPIEEP